MNRAFTERGISFLPWIYVQPWEKIWMNEFSCSASKWCEVLSTSLRDLSMKHQSSQWTKWHFLSRYCNMPSRYFIVVFSFMIFRHSLAMNSHPWVHWWLNTRNRVFSVAFLYRLHAWSFVVLVQNKYLHSFDGSRCYCLVFEGSENECGKTERATRNRLT